MRANGALMVGRFCGLSVGPSGHWERPDHGGVPFTCAAGITGAVATTFPIMINHHVDLANFAWTWMVLTWTWRFVGVLVRLA